MQVLYVDDDELLLEIAGDFVAGAGIKLIRVSESLRAVDAMLAQPLDLVLLDVMMPEQDGLETLRLLRQHAALDQTPVAFVTADAEEENILALLAAGAEGVIAKPFSPSGLVASIRRLAKMSPSRAAR